MAGALIDKKFMMERVESNLHRLALSPNYLEGVKNGRVEQI
jgi:hypothetical protein